jgi:3-hydroxymyristoyl/3-hydroxydecanoyl-(acyl carrier protein) dehydratase
MRSKTLAVPATHPAFAGHFPGQPLLPGVVLLAEAMEALLEDAQAAAALGAHPRLGHVKFLAPVRPGARIEVRWSAASPRVRFEVWRHAEGDAPQGQLAATGQFEAVA